MEVRHERDENGLTTVRVEVPAETVDESLDRSIKQLRRHVTVPGFRPGRVPPKMVESILGSGPVAEYAKEILLERVYSDAMAELPTLVGLDDPEIEVGDLQRGQPCEVVIKVLTAVVQLPEYEGIPVEQVRAEATEEEARDQLEERYASQAVYSAADHDDVRDGDHIVFALRIIRDGFLVEEYDAEDPLRVQVGNNNLVPNIDDQLLGLSVGQSTTFEITYPDDFDNEDLRGATAEFTVEVIEIQARETLDEFVARGEEFETVDEAVAGIREQLLEWRTDQRRVSAREELVRKVVEAATIDLPRAKLDADVMDEIDEFEDSLEARGIDPLSLDEDEVERQHAAIRERVEYDAKRQVLLQAIAQAEKIEVDREDLARDVAMIAAFNQVEPRLMLRRLDEQGMMHELVRGARNRKAAELLLSKATVTEVDPPAEEEEGGETADAAVTEPDVAALDVSAASLEETAEAAATADPEDE